MNAPLNQLRQQIRTTRRALTPEQQHVAANSVAQRLLSHSKIQHAQHIALYLATDGEIDTRFLIQQLWQQKKQLYLPVIHPFCAGHLLFLHYRPESPMTASRYGFIQPKLDVRQVCPLNQLQVIITPLVAFDLEGNRLGMGGGYYDRTLQRWRDKGCYPIGIAHDCQLVPQLSHQHWDIPLPEIITPSKQWLWQSGSAEPVFSA